MLSSADDNRRSCFLRIRISCLCSKRWKQLEMKSLEEYNDIASHHAMLLFNPTITAQHFKVGDYGRMFYSVYYPRQNPPLGVEVVLRECQSLKARTFKNTPRHVCQLPTNAVNR